MNVDHISERLNAVKTDADVAAELRTAIAPHVKGICEVMDQARAAGMKIDLVIMPDQFGRHIPPHISITKAL